MVSTATITATATITTTTTITATTTITESTTLFCNCCYNGWSSCTYSIAAAGFKKALAESTAESVANNCCNKDECCCNCWIICKVQYCRAGATQSLFCWIWAIPTCYMYNYICTVLAPVMTKYLVQQENQPFFKIIFRAFDNYARWVKNVGTSFNNARN